MYNCLVNFSDLTTLKIGGPAREIVSVKTEQNLINAVKELAINGELFLMIGSGSNLLVSDAGFSGTIIKNEVTGIKRQGNDLIVAGGTILQNLVDFANEQGLSGLENLAGIPGTVGGAVYGNAGAYGQTISDHLIAVRVLDPNIVTSSDSEKSVERETDSSDALGITKEESEFKYRDSAFKRNKNIILEATFSLTSADSEALKKTSEETIKKREVKYPPGIKCPGSFFKNIPADTLPSEILAKLPKEFILYGKVSTGALLESVGARGAKQGNILIAPYHANLFINEGNGTAADFCYLAKTYSQKVFEKFGIRLEPEVQLINLPAL